MHSNANETQSGPVKAPKPKPRSLVEDESELGLEKINSKEDPEDPEEGSPIKSSSLSDEHNIQVEVERPRKRRRVETDDLEGAYFQKTSTRGGTRGTTERFHRARTLKR